VATIVWVYSHFKESTLLGYPNLGVDLEVGLVFQVSFGLKTAVDMNHAVCIICLASDVLVRRFRFIRHNEDAVQLLSFVPLI